MPPHLIRPVTALRLALEPFLAPSLRAALAGPWRRGVVRVAAICLALSWAGFAAAGPTLETLVDFASGPSSPGGPLVKGSDGNFYGTTVFGGAPNCGTIFRLTPAGAISTLVEFSGTAGTNRGRFPEALILGSDGNFYGTTYFGGALDQGTVYRLTPAGVQTTLVEFTGTGGAHRGAQPNFLMGGSDGNLYGVTQNGGVSDNGTIYRLTPAGELTTLVEFSDLPGSGYSLFSALVLVQGNDGNIYGGTGAGGVLRYGTIFRLTPAGKLTTLLEFTGTSGAHLGRLPVSLVQGSDGYFYGTTNGGGSLDKGTFFRMTPAGVLTTLVDFAGTAASNRGFYPGISVQGNDGSFYGSAAAGGASDCGTLFRVSPAGELTTLVEFTGTGGAHRGKGSGPLVPGSDGNFYGVTYSGGAADKGTVYRLRFVPDGSPTQFISLAVEPGTGTRVQWQTASGQVSRVEYSDDLTGAWQSFAGSVTADGSGMVSYLDPTQPRPAQRFYRLVTPP